MTDDEDPQGLRVVREVRLLGGRGEHGDGQGDAQLRPELTVIINLYRNHQDGVTTEDYEFTPDCFCAFFNSGDSEKSVTLTEVQDTVDD